VADDLNALARDLGEVPRETVLLVRKAVEVSARNIKDLIRDEYSGARALPGASRSISYDKLDGGLSAEIGPELGGQGSIVGLVDEGAPRTPGRKRIPKALQDEAPGFDRGLEQAIDGGLKAVGM
jgi:hypothetical protein